MKKKTKPFDSMSDASFGDRQARQNGENAQTYETQMPEARLQGSKQVLNPDQLGGLSSPVTGTAGRDTRGTAAREIKANISVRPAASVEVLENKQVGGVPLGGGQTTRSAAGVGGVAQSVSDDTSKVPYQQGQYRPDTRYGKKRSEELFELDNTVSEQVVPVVDDALDLREAPDSVMGYNGRKQFKQVRAKKNTRGLPQTLLFEASADLEFHSYEVATTGQVLDNIQAQANYPTRTYNAVENTYQNIPTPMRKSNYRLEGLEITTSGGHISGIRFLETEVPSHVDTLTRDEANHNWQVDANNVTRTMMRLQSEMGRETTDKWSPLGYVIDQPYEYNMLMHDIEATTGAIAAIAYRSACSSMAAQRNIIAKDGIGTEAAANRMFFEGCLGSLTSSTITDSWGMDRVFNRSMYQRGSAAAIIEMFDSTRKYRTKADILGMQRSLSLHLSQADNNLNPLHCKPEFLRVLNKAHLFSTEDGQYNPMLPIHLTRKIHLVNPLSLNYFLMGWVNPHTTNITGGDVARDAETGLLTAYVYNYADIRNKYSWSVHHPIVSGLVMWLLKHEGAFCSTYGNNAKVVMPASFDFYAPSAFQFMLCSALQLVSLKRNQIFRDILFAGEQTSYIWDDLVDLKSNDPLHSTQLTITGYNEPLKLGKMDTDTAIRTYWSDVISIVGVMPEGEGTGKTVYTMPWYMTEQVYPRENLAYSEATGFRDEASAFNMAIPSIRHGVRHSYVDIIKSVSDNDVRLAMDRMLTIPVQKYSYAAQANANTDRDATYFVAVYNGTRPDNLNDLLTDNIHFGAIRYDVNSDGRLLVSYDVDWSLGSGENPVTPYSVLAVPKELGWLWNGLEGSVPMVTSVEFDSSGNITAIGGTAERNYTTYPVEEREDVFAFALFSSVCSEIRSYRVPQDADNALSINRSAALRQAYRTCYSSPLAHDVNEAYTAWTGIAVNLSYEDGYEHVNGIYPIRGAAPVTNGDDIVITQLDTRSRSLWSALQRTFHPVNPFENCYDVPDARNYIPLDPLEGAFYFGVCGFLASDYTQAVLERLDTFDQLGLDYTEDVNTKASLLFR